MFRNLFLLSSLIPAITAAEIAWKSSCGPELAPYNSALPIVCGSLAVPDDYTAVDLNRTHDLLLYKIPVANGTKSKHSVLVNFGGPGNDGLGLLTANATSLRLLLGNDHDIILVNPRGTGANFNFSCSQNAAQGAMQASWTSLDGNASDVAPGQIWATTDLYANACKVSPTAANGDLIGTAFTARDFMQVAEALHEDGMIYYQGFSYGTLLGMTIAALFPDKIGRMVLDGNVNAYEYYQNSYVGHYADADEVFSIFCSTCVATPHSCALARNQSAADLKNELIGLFDHLKARPLPASFPDGSGGLVDYSFVTSMVYSSLYLPTTWPGLSVALASLLAGNATIIPEASLIPTVGLDPLFGIACSDSRIRTSDPSSLDSFVNATEAKSPLFGSGTLAYYYTCAQWQFFAKDNFTWPAGNVSVQTKNPVLLIGNSHDPATSFQNAMYNSAALNRSVLLRHDGVGHTAFLSEGSLCTAKAMQSYWLNGTLPQPGTVCETNTPVFSLDNGWETVLKQLAQESGDMFP